MPNTDPVTLLEAHRERGCKTLDEASGKSLLAAFGIHVPMFRVIGTEADLDAIEGVLRPPYVLKVMSELLVHKSDVGGVKTGLGTQAEVARAMHAMRSSLAERGIRADAWLVEEMAPAGLECVVGGVIDSEFGPMVMVGLGGIFVELMGDVVFRICPIGAQDALEMVEQLRGAPLMRGIRGREAVSIDSLTDALVKVGGENGILMTCGREIREIDINPLIVTRDGAIAVDARVILASQGLAP